MVQARVIDLDGVYDPCQPNDRLLLGIQAAGGTAEVVVDHFDLAEAALPRNIDELVLASLALQIALDLRLGGVTRPGFERLVAGLCGGEVGAVLCFDASRIGRNGPCASASQR